MEFEDVVFQEALSGDSGRNKAAQSLIYINDYCRESIEDEVVSPYFMGKFINIDSVLKEKIVAENTAFGKSSPSTEAKKISEAIAERF